MLIQARDLPSNYKLAPHAADKVLLMADRFTRSQGPHAVWAEVAKMCVEFVEGKQWTAEELKAADDEDRPALTFNEMGRLIRLVLGYHRNNRTDIKYLPGMDGSGTQAMATSMSQLSKAIAEMNKLPYVDAEVFMDGIITGRGFYDYRLDFEKNDLGEIKIKAADPFSTYLDPDADEYDLNSGNYVFDARWASIDEVEFLYGPEAAMLLWPLVHTGSYGGGIPNSIVEYTEEITPWRSFGGQAGGPMGSTYMAVDSYLVNSYDPTRKNIRILDCQHYVRKMMWHFIDIETGDKEPVPETWTPDDVKKVLLFAEKKAAMKGQMSSLRVMKRPGRKLRWTTMVGDLVLYDDWSIYETFTKIAYFPWFRRGKTKGMAEDLLDPQKELNKRGSAEVDIVTRTAHSGWKYHSKSLREEEKIKLERYGAMAGINIEWEGEQWMEPKKIEPGAPPTAMDKLEQKNSDRLTRISGINESALGELDRVQSGRAIEARQRQSVLAIQVYMDNMSRSKELCGYKTLEMVQNHYTERRVVRVLGMDGKANLLVINDRPDPAGEIVNNVTAGKYTVNVDETPLASSYIQGQFEELLMMVDKGILPKEVVMDIIVDTSSIPHKDIVKQRVQAMMGAMGIPVGDQLLTPEGAAAVVANQMQVAAAGAQPAGGGKPGGPAKPGGAQPAKGPGAPPSNASMAAPAGMTSKVTPTGAPA